jgi:putative SOS response-associated peptidase YedK
VKNRRCLVPASGFFEWEHGGKRKTPYYITVRGQALFAFAGLHDTWKSPDGSILRTYTIITTRPNDMVARVHDRMPAILLPQHEDIWAGQAPLTSADLAALLAPCPADAMEMHRVSDRINSPLNDTPDVIRSINNGSDRF